MTPTGIRPTPNLDFPARRGCSVTGRSATKALAQAMTTMSAASRGERAPRHHSRAVGLYASSRDANAEQPTAEDV